jgi:AraC family transcriptional regulator
MNWAEGIQDAIDYIEENITEELNYENIAARAACSAFYFQRIFGALCGMTLGEYIRCRRLSLAGCDLISTQEKVIDIAMKYGYNSPDSFTRAFTAFHGVTPSEARQKKASLKSFSRLRVQLILKGGNNMEYKIIEKEAFTVLEKVERHSVAVDQNQNTVPEFWGRAQKEGIIDTLLSSSSDPGFIFGICYGSGHTKVEHFDYSIAVQCSSDTVAPEGYRINTIPARKWMVAECTGPMPDAIQQLWHEICADFFPTSGYEPTYEMDIEVYPAGDMTAPDYKSQIWIPIKK